MPTMNIKLLSFYYMTNNISLYTNANKYYDDTIWKKVR